MLVQSFAFLFYLTAMQELMAENEQGQAEEEHVLGFEGKKEKGRH